MHYVLTSMTCTCCAAACSRDKHSVTEAFTHCADERQCWTTLRRLNKFAENYEQHGPLCQASLPGLEMPD